MELDRRGFIAAALGAVVLAPTKITKPVIKVTHIEHVNGRGEVCVHRISVMRTFKHEGLYVEHKKPTGYLCGGFDHADGSGSFSQLTCA